MTEKAALLAQRLIRNVEQVEMKHDRRPPLYDSVGARNRPSGGVTVNARDGARPMLIPKFARE